MNAAANLLARLRDAGATITTEDGKILVRGLPPELQELRAAVREHKAALLELLSLNAVTAGQRDVDQPSPAAAPPTTPDPARPRWSLRDKTDPFPVPPGLRVEVLTAAERLVNAVTAGQRDVDQPSPAAAPPTTPDPARPRWSLRDKTDPFPVPPGLRVEVLTAAERLGWPMYPACPTTNWSEISGQRSWRVFVAVAPAGALATMRAVLQGARP